MHAYGDRYSSQTKSLPDPTRPVSLCLSCLPLPILSLSVSLCLSCLCLSPSAYPVFVSLCLSCLCIMSLFVYAASQLCPSVHVFVTPPPMVTGIQVRPKASQTTQTPQSQSPSVCVSCLCSLSQSILSLQSLSVYPVSAVSLSLSCLCSLSQSILSLQSLSVYPVCVCCISVSYLCVSCLCMYMSTHHPW